MSDELLYEASDGVARITFNRPENMNGLTPGMLDALPVLLREGLSDAAVRVLVLTGAGERAFSAGADLGGPFKGKADAEPRPRPTREQAADGLRRQQEASILLHAAPKPSVAVINGAAAGASLAMALACDFRIAVDEAVLRTAFANIALSGDYGSSYFLTTIVGGAKARELLMLADKINAEEALRLGLVHRVFPRTTFSAECDGFVRRLAEGPPLAYRFMKRHINLAESGAPLSEVLDREAEAMVSTASSRDFKAASKAFLEKKKPEFEGR